MTRTSSRVATCIALLALGCLPTSVFGQVAPSLGSAQSFAVLAGSTVTNTGATNVVGNVGVSPGTAVTGFFPPGIVVGGTIHSADAVALAAQGSALTAYNDLSQPCTQNLSGQDLGGKILTAGVYCFDAAAQLTGTVTLNAQGNANAVFIFRIGSALTTASASAVSIINGGSLCNVFWQVGSSATLGTTTAFVGNILAVTSITLTTGATVAGRLLARNGAVTLDSNTVTASCFVPPPPVCPAITLLPAALPNGTVGVAYSQTIVGNGGTAPYVFTLTGGALPPGMSLTPAGVVAGTPLAAGNATFTVRGTDAAGCFASITYTIAIAALPPPPPVCPPITLTPATLAGGVVGVAYNETFNGSGGTPPYVFGATSGIFPIGVTLTSTGVFAGTPLVAGTFNFVVRVTDANGCFASIAYSIVIAPAPVIPSVCPAITLSPPILPNGSLGTAYSQAITASGGVAPYAFGVTAGTLPAGLTLTAGGLLSGTPTTPGTSTVIIRGTDANGCFAELPYALTVITAVPTLPHTFAWLLAGGLTAAGYLRLRRQAGSRKRNP